MSTISLFCRSATIRYLSKKHPALAELMADAPVGLPYEGAKEHYILDVENRALAARVIEILERVTPVSKRRAQKTYGIR